MADKPSTFDEQPYNPLKRSKASIYMTVWMVYTINPSRTEGMSYELESEVAAQLLAESFDKDWNTYYEERTWETED